jgi:hypothetical protein
MPAANGRIVKALDRKAAMRAVEEREATNMVFPLGIGYSRAGLLACVSANRCCLPRARAPVAFVRNASLLDAHSYGVVADLHRASRHPAGWWMDEAEHSVQLTDEIGGPGPPVHRWQPGWESPCVCRGNTRDLRAQRVKCSRLRDPSG